MLGSVLFYVVIAVLIFGVLIAADYCIMIGGMLVTGHFPNYWSIRFGK